MAGVVIAPRARLLRGHVWATGREVVRTWGEPEPGDVVELADPAGRPLGSGFWNPTSHFAVRLLTRHPVAEVGAAFVAERLRAALRWRQAAAGVDPRLCRVVWSEADGLPGLVVDRYGDHLGIQVLTLGIERRREDVVAALVDVLAPRSIVERSEGPARRAEGLEPARGALVGEVPPPFAVDSGSAPFVVDLAGGQKTGLYLDQLGNHAAVAALAAGRRVLDGFCNQGGFALAAARAGASSVTGVDSSAAALALAAANAERSGVEVTWVEANVFDHLRALDRKRAVGHYDLVVLDPPPFAPNRRSLPGARRGYKELNLRALRLLEPGGLLATFSCSHHVGRAELEDVLLEAAVDARRTLRVVGEHGQRADHPVLVGVPETRYLSGLTVAVVDAW